LVAVVVEPAERPTYFGFGGETVDLLDFAEFRCRRDGAFQS